MKHPFLTFICLIFLCSNLKAQDTIFMRSGEKIIAKIIELNTREVKYKKFDFQDGPLYVVSKTDIFKIAYVNGMTENLEDENAIVQTNDYSKPKKNEANTSITTRKNLLDNPIEIIGNRYYLNYYLSIPEVNRLLLAKKNKEITTIVLATKKQMVSYYILVWTPIPLGVAGYTLLNLASYGSSNYSSTLTSLNPDYLAGALLCATGAIALRVFATMKKRKINLQRQKAVQIYNATYYRNGKQ